MEGKKISKDDMNIEHLDVSRNQIIWMLTCLIIGTECNISYSENGNCMACDSTETKMNGKINK